jgi:hypothetical protein
MANKLWDFKGTDGAGLTAANTGATTVVQNGASNVFSGSAGSFTNISGSAGGVARLSTTNANNTLAFEVDIQPSGPGGDWQAVAFRSTTGYALKFVYSPSGAHWYLTDAGGTTDIATGVASGTRVVISGYATVDTATTGVYDITIKNYTTGSTLGHISSSTYAYLGTDPLAALDVGVINTPGSSSVVTTKVYKVKLNDGQTTAAGPAYKGKSYFLNTSTDLIADPALVQTGAPIAAGDWMFLALGAQSAETNVKTPTIDSSWTTIRAWGTVTGGTSSFGLYARMRQAGDTTYDFPLTNTSRTNGLNARLVWGADAAGITDMVAGTFADRITNATSTTTLAPAITTTAANSLVLAFSMERTVAAETPGQITTNNGFTQVLCEQSADDGLTIAEKTMTTTGTAGATTFTYPNAHTNNGVAGMVALSPAVVSSGLPIKVSNGTTLNTAYFKIADGSGNLVTPGGLKVVKPGYASVTQMLAQPLFYCAHRGGSVDFPEMSMYAYGQSALWGYPALEISLSRTSDGVWFGLHDGSLDRTSLNTGGGSGTTLVAANMTWAQVQAYSILGAMAGNNPGQPDRPYMRWEELIAMYYSSHVIFVDPKVAIAHTSELLTMMDALPGSTTRFVAKYYGVAGNTANTTGWAHDAAVHGYKSWGYFYQADVPNLATYQGRWDILGMDYTADQASWNSILAYGKPVIGHICPNLAAANTAITKGATGLMVSGVKSILPPAIS